MNLQRLLIERIENRILVGITLFLATMVLVGWVAINEPGRLASFQQQHLARSVEKGAELFASNCAECHGPSGLGSGRAPGLNNPQLFGVNFLASIDGEIARLEDVIATIEIDTSTLDAGAVEAHESQLAAYIEEFGEDPLTGAAAALSAAQTERQTTVSQMQVAIDRGYNPETPDRLGVVGWNGTLHSFVLTTLISGRPVSSSYWPAPMPAWSNTAGGPLRGDQVEDITNYVMNWGANRQWTTGDLLAVQQFAKVPVEGGGAIEDPIAPDVANIQLTDVEANRAMIDETINTVMSEAMVDMIGDPLNGQALYTGSLACSACHSNAAIAPPTEGTFTRVQNTRLQDPALAGYTAEHYLIESILVPNAYVAANYPANAMPQNFGERLTAQDLVDLLAYLQSQDGDDPLAQ